MIATDFDGSPYFKSRFLKAWASWVKTGFVLELWRFRMGIGWEMSNMTSTLQVSAYPQTLHIVICPFKLCITIALSFFWNKDKGLKPYRAA